MKISGFSFVRNAVAFDYPVSESLASLLPVCDELVVAVGDCSDGTRELVAAADDRKLRIIDTVWDESMRTGGRILAEQTDIALAECAGDWCIYLQADEALHENDYDRIIAEITNADRRADIDGLIFRYHHFYGSYDYVGTGRQWYRREVRAFRNTGRVFSWGDAQGFRQRNDAGEAVKLRAHQTEVRVYHYGWVKPPKAQQAKQLAVNRYWHDDAWIEANVGGEEFDYASAYQLERFNGTHPAVMAERIEKATAWTRQFDPARLRSKPPMMRLSDWIESHTGWRIGEYKNFIEA